MATLIQDTSTVREAETGYYPSDLAANDTLCCVLAMASPGADIGPKNQEHNQHPEPTPEPAFQEAQKWIEVS